MGLKSLFKNPSEVDAPFVWGNIHLKNRLRELEANKRNPPTVTRVPETWMPLVMGILMWHHVVLRYLVLS